MTGFGAREHLSEVARRFLEALAAGVLLMAASLASAFAQQPSAAPDAKQQDTICKSDAPWNRHDSFDHRADDIRKASDWAPTPPYSEHPAGKLAGEWTFELKGVPGGGDVATAGRMMFFQEGQHSECKDVCSLAPAKASDKWMAGGVRWGHKNYGLRTPDNPEDIPPGYITVAGSGDFAFPQPEFYSFPKIVGHFDPASDNAFTGVWTMNIAGEEKTGKAVFKRFEPKITRVKFTSTVENEVRPTDIGCVALDYSAQDFGPGNDMRGNRPGFDIDVYGDGFSRMASEYYRVWIDPETKLEVDSGSPGLIFAKDEAGKTTDKVIGLHIHINIWPGSEWGPKTLYVEGEPITFDYYVKPVYDFDLPQTRFKLVEGHYPEKPHAGRRTHVGFRLVNLPDYAADNTILNLTFVDAADSTPASSVKPLDKVCSGAGPGKVQCKFDKTTLAGLDEVEMLADMPEGGLRWTAEWTTDAVPDSSIRSGDIKADTSPQIVYAFSLSDQTSSFRPQTTDFNYPYPNGGKVSQKREVVLFGKNLLPKEPGGVPHIDSLDPAISYQPRTGNVYSDRYDAAWKNLEKRFKVPAETLKKDFQILLLEASINGVVLPGVKSLKLDGALASWDLRFGGLKAEIEFVRENDPYEDNVDDADDDVLTTAYVPERIYVRVKTSSSLPVDELPMTLYLQQTVSDPTMAAAGAKPATHGGINFIATRTSQGYYYSPPIRLIDKGNRRLSPLPESGDIPVNIFVNRNGTDQLAAEIDPIFALYLFAMPFLPAGPAIPISRTPARHRSSRDPNQESDYLFKSALAEAAQCHPDVEINFLGYARLKDVQVDDWDKLSESEAERFYNLVLLTFDDDHFRTTTVTFGHHAAMLLMRKMLVEMLNDQIGRDTEILQSELTLKGFLKAMRFELDNDHLPINRIKVTAPDGSQVEYGSSALSEDIDELARRFNSTPEEIAKWRLTATAEAISRIDAAASEAAEAARQVDKCDVKGLLKLTGSGFAAVNKRLEPRLMHLVENPDNTGRTHLYWEPDEAARAWVENISDTAKRYHAQTAAAEQDNMLLTVAFGLISLPVMAVSSTAMALTLTAADLSLLGADAASAWEKSYQSYAEIDFSRDAAVVIGLERNEEAVKTAYDWLDAYERTLFDVMGAAGAIVGASEKVADGLLRSEGVVVKGRAAAQEVAEQGSLRALSETEQRDLQLFAMRAKAREIAGGAEALDALERRAIQAVDEDFRSMRTQLINAADEAHPLGQGEEIALPFPFDLKEARVRFEPVAPRKAIRLDKNGLPAWELEEPVKMLRAADEISEDMSLAAQIADTQVFDETGTAILTKEQIDTILSESQAALRNERRDLQRFLAETFGDKAHRMANREFVVPSRVTQRGPFPIEFGKFRGSGTFAAAIENKTPFAKVKSLWKFSIGEPDKAAVAGKAYLEAVDSQHIVLARETARVPIPKDIGGELQGFREMYLVEDLGQTVETTVKSNAFTQAERVKLRSALHGAIDDLNDRGIVMADYKLNNMAPVERGDAVKIGFFDYGGFIRAKGGDPALAREMQNFLSGPPEEAFRILQKYGRTDIIGDELTTLKNHLGRRDAFINLYRDRVDDLDKLGAHVLDDVDFNPSGSELLDPETNAYFTAARRNSR